MKLENLLTALPDQEVTRDVLREKYAKGDETTARDVRERVARALASVEAGGQQDFWQGEFLWAMENGFVPAGRINSAAGTALQATLINCFVQPIGDAISGIDEQGTPGIYLALQEAAETMRRGGGVGYDFSPIRPRGALVQGHPITRLRPGVVHAGLRQVVRDARVRRVAPRCADGRDAGGPSRRRGIHRRQERRVAVQLQHVGGGHRRVHARGGTGRGFRPGACSAALRRRYRPATSGRRLALPERAGARTLGPHHAFDLRSRRAGCDLHRSPSTGTTTSPTANGLSPAIRVASSSCRPTAAAISAA